jgi:hypothetical protein
MRKALLTGMLAFMGAAATIGALVAATGTAAPAVSSASASSASSARSSAADHFSSTLYHMPLQGLHLLKVALPHGVRHTTDVQSDNWSGYADIGTASGNPDVFETVAGSWTEPKVTCPANGGLFGIGGSKTAYSAFWVGLDGYSSSSVEQLGTDSDCLSSGAPHYYAWYEMYPAGSVDLPSSDAVNPGDVMVAMVMSNAAGTSFDLSIKDVTHPWASPFSIPETASGLARSSAEFVAEAPSECNAVTCEELKLADFGSVTFTGANAADTSGVMGAVDAFENADMQMAENGTVKATPSKLTDSGGASSFTVTWSHD